MLRQLSFMNLPHPKAEYAGCYWLPRLVGKIRNYCAGQLPLSYRLALGSRIGVDGYFLRHFKLTMPDLIAAVRRSKDDQELINWFLSQPSVSPASIREWNKLAVSLGRKGCPAHVAHQIVCWLLYPKSILHPVSSVFELIEQDEGLSVV
jgi:hypothetical protein